MFKKRETKNTVKVVTLSDQEGCENNQNTLTRKKVKLEVPKGVIASTTKFNRQQKEKDFQESLDELNYKGTNAIAGNHNEQLFKENEIDTQKDRDARAKVIENIQITKKIKEGTIDTGTYRGLNGYANYTANEQLITNSKYKGNFGPLRASSSIRVSSRFDYNPQLCKDWHDTGYCVFGNSCLYLHDRTNYKTGWQQEKDFEEQERERWKRINNPNYQEEFEFKEELDKNMVPEICKFCNQNFNEPVSIECGHLFCEACAIKQHSTKKKCVECSKPTTGLMNEAGPLLEKLRLNYEELKKQLQKKSQMNKVTRKRYTEADSQKMFMVSE